MNEAKDLKEIKEFSTGNKIRDLILKEMNPTITKVTDQCQQIRQEMQLFQQKYSNVIKFETEKLNLEKTLKQMNSHFFNMNSQLVALKTEFQLNQSKTSIQYAGLKGELETFQRNLSRRDDTLETYDRKISGAMESITKHQILNGDRMTVFQERFKKLSKETLEMAKTLKQDFDKAQMQNHILKSELLAKMSHNTDKQKILDLYMSEREETSKRLMQLEQGMQAFVVNKEFEDFKKVQASFLEDRLSEIKKIIGQLLPEQTLRSLKIINVKFAEIEELKFKISKNEEELKQSLHSIHNTIKTIEEKGEEQLLQVRTEQEEAEQKIIEEIDKRFQTIEENIDQRGTQTEEDLEGKLLSLKTELQSAIKIGLLEQKKEIETLKEARKIINEKGEENMISEELAVAKEERLKVQSYGQNIKEIANGLNEKLSFFSNKLTICRSDIELFTIETKKELKKITQLKNEHEKDMENTGKLLSTLTESILILISLGLTADKPKQNNAFSTYQDGIILELDPKLQHNHLAYRRTLINSTELKESLLYSLLNIVDENIISNGFLKWDLFKPSKFFKNIKENLQIKTKTSLKNLTLPFPSRKKSASRVEQDDSILLEYKKDGDETNRETNIPQQKSRITIANEAVWSRERPNSEMHRKYKMKKPEQLMFKRQNSERQCFTASKSHRKSKIVCL